MAYSDLLPAEGRDIRGPKGTPYSLEQRATANKMGMLNRRPSPLEQAMMPKGNFETIAPPKGIFEPPVKPRMDMIGDIRKKQMPDMELPYKPMQGEMPKQPIGMPPKQPMGIPPKQPMGMPIKQPMGMPPEGDILTSPKSSPVTPPPNIPVGIPQSPKGIVPPNTPPEGDILTAPKGNVVTPPIIPPIIPQNQVDPVAPPKGGGVTPPPDIIPPDIPKGNVVPPPIGGVTPPVIPQNQVDPFAPPKGGGGLPPPPDIQPPKGGGTSPTVPSVPAAQPSVPAEEPWQDNAVGAGTSSFQNPYTNISGEMGSGIDYLREQGINVGDNYAKYFRDYDPTEERAAIQQHGLGQDTSMAAARSNLMQMTQQGLGSGFGGVGFGGAGASGIRSQFGLGAQQAGLSLRGDIYGMRRDQEEDWWDTLASVEQRRGEMFGFGVGGYNDLTPEQKDQLEGSGFGGQYTGVVPPTGGVGGVGGGYTTTDPTAPETEWWQTTGVGA